MCLCLCCLFMNEYSPRERTKRRIEGFARKYVCNGYISKRDKNPFQKTVRYLEGALETPHFSKTDLLEILADIKMKNILGIKDREKRIKQLQKHFFE